MRSAHRLIGILTGLLLVGTVAAAQAQPQLTGTWVLDRAQSQLPTHRGHAGPDAQAQPSDVKLLVQQQGNTMKATRMVARGNVERSVAVTYLTDGSEQSHAGRRGTVVTRAAYEGDRLVVNKTYTKKTEQGDKSMSRESIWTLSPDGKVLTIDTTMRSSRGERTMKAVFLRS
jgi:hypothetical protein